MPPDFAQGLAPLRGEAFAEATLGVGEDQVRVDRDLIHGLYREPRVDQGHEPEEHLASKLREVEGHAVR
eukprot:3935083-Rhodomonas_salina.2